MPAEETNQDVPAEQKHAEEELQKSIVRNEQVAQLYEKLYEDNASGKEQIILNNTNDYKKE